jgi:pilus assembly protein Flp/PilA
LVIVAGLGAVEGQLHVGAVTMFQLLVRFWEERSGATAIEYGLIAAGIAAVIIVAVNTLGSNLTTTFSSVSTAIK